MSIFIMHTAEKINNHIYENVFKGVDNIFFGEFVNEDYLFYENRLNFSKLMPQYISADLLQYSEELKGEFIGIYENLKKSFFQKYCYFLQRFQISQLWSTYDYEYFFYLHLKFVLRFLVDKNINIIYMGPPSCGVDNLIYEVAKIKKIKTICLYQAHNGRFFWVTEWGDIGSFKTSKEISPPSYIRLSSVIADPFYMIRVEDRKIDKTNLIKKRNILKSPVNFFRLYLYAFRLHLFFLNPKNRGSIYRIPKILLELYKIVDRVGSNLDLMLKKVNDKSTNYLSNIKNTNSPCDFKILFYLKVQPEATEGFPENFITNPLVMLSKLLEKSPRNTTVFIKEHPDNLRNFSGSKRYFWESLKFINGIKILDVDVPTASVLNEVDIVATFDGTVGWEALRNGKPVVVFGAPWYRCMPGVFSIDEVTDLENIARFKFDGVDLHKNLVKLSTFMGEGYVVDISEGYINAIDEFVPVCGLSNEEKMLKLKNNDLIVAQSFLKIYEAVDKDHV